MTIRPRSLQGRLLALVLGVVVVSWIGAALAIWIDARHELDELLDGHLAQAAALLVVQQLRTEDDDDHAVDAPLLHRYAPQVAFQLWHDGRLVTRSSNAPTTPMHEPGHAFRTGFRTLHLDGTPWRVFATYGAERDVQVYVGERMKSRAAILRAVLRGLLLSLAVSLPLLGLGAWWAVRQGLLPLRRIGRELGARDPQALQPLVLPDAPREMAPMLDALNGLLARIGALLDGERRFTADAAHELRTPIAAIRAQAQVALAETDDAARRHALQATLQGCDRAARLVDQLLTLARVEADGTLAGAADVDLAALLRRVAAEIAPRALERGQQLEVDADRPGVVRGHEALLAVLLRNLLDNAVRYSPDGAGVHARVRCDGDDVEVCIEDGGPGLADADRQRLGERFFRVLGTQAAGSGLGWSIVRRVAAVHGAAVTADRSASLGGLRVTLRLKGRGAGPAAPPA